MMLRIATLALCFALPAMSGAVHAAETAPAVDYQALIDRQRELLALRGAEMQRRMQADVDALMEVGTVRRAYDAYVAGGGRLSTLQYGHAYFATNGFAAGRMNPNEAYADLMRRAEERFQPRIPPRRDNGWGQVATPAAPDRPARAVRLPDGRIVALPAQLQGVFHRDPGSGLTFLRPDPTSVYLHSPERRWVDIGSDIPSPETR